MRFDEYGLLITEEPTVGRFGDSCAETSRFCVLERFIKHAGSEFKVPDLALRQFLTEKGIVRHPLSPWREDDTSWDQKLPLFYALRLFNDNIGMKSFTWFERYWFSHFIGIKSVTQALIFKLPYRWNDSKRWFEKSSESSCDYLNFIIGLVYLTMIRQEGLLVKLALKLTWTKFYDKTIDYYNNPSNSNLFIIDLYIKAFWKLKEIHRW